MTGMEARGVFSRNAFPAAILSLTVGPRNCESFRTMFATLALRTFGLINLLFSADCPRPHEMRPSADTVKRRLVKALRHCIRRFGTSGSHECGTVLGDLEDI